MTISSGYTNTVFAGFGWQTVLKAAVSLVSVVKIMFLARLLSPDDFGVFALIAIALGIAEATTQTGVNVTIMQSKHDIAYFLDTAWVIAIIRGLLIGCLMILMGIVMSSFYQNEVLLPLIALTAIVPIIKGFINPSIVLYQKNFAFFADSLYKLSLAIVQAVVAVLATLVLKSVVALVLALIVSAVFEVILSFLLFKTRPKFAYNSSRAKVIFDNAKGLSVSAFFSYIHENVDDFVLGRITGTYGLGLYHNAYSITHKANFEVAKLINYTLLPVFMRISDDLARLKRAFFRGLATTIALTTIASLPLYLFPEFFVQLVLGEEWLSVTTFIRPLLLAGIIQSITIIMYTLCLAKKRFALMNIHLGTTVAILIALLVTFGNKLGVGGAVQAVLISRALTLPFLTLGVFGMLRSTQEKHAYAKK